jgi:two-component system, OmpR family, response regulator
MFPRTLALVDDDLEYTDFLAQYLADQGVEVQVFLDSNALLVHPLAYEYGFYVVDLMLPGVSGEELIRILRLRTRAGILVVSGRVGPTVFDEVLTAGADMHLVKPVTFAQVALAVRTVHRRVGGGAPAEMPWKLDRRARLLLAPDGSGIELSDGDLKMLECFLEAGGDVVTRGQLQQRMGRPAADDTTDSVYAAIFRLRRRIERSTSLNVPLQAKARVGYRFRAKLTAY